ncbi:MAG: pantetheine-phosphate adenylyltransferase [uncultured bacterium (gcode 4)]|uniref:Pantetheine-phosphate adenylyltransferase n=1 Tax=uncultured bacterium (gcode 4) TaxID=1234023 RepID=K2FGM1_9BACT|nr:MAG: pantetheine-phosphate adenylyltransferase [uncultured bacterium (gcode 4)]
MMGINKLIFWVAGGIASGKSTLCKQLREDLQAQGIKCHWIEADLVRRHILYKSKEINHYKARTALIKSFNIKETSDNFLPADIWKMIFSQKKKMEIYKELINPEIIEALKLKIESLEGVVLIEWAMLIEDWMMSLADNNVILLWIDEDLQLQRLENGWLSNSEIRHRIKFTNSSWTDNREKIILKAQKEKWFWKLFTIRDDSEKEIKVVVDFIHSSLSHENNWTI